MRGIAVNFDDDDLADRITPACAGNSYPDINLTLDE